MVRIVRLVFALILMIASGTTVAWSQTSATLEAQPAIVEVAPWTQQVEARIVLKNGGNDALVNPRLVAFTNDSLDVNIESRLVSDLGALDSVVWTVHINKIDQARIPGSVQFEATYTMSGRNAVQRLYTTLKVQLSATAADKAIEVSVQGSFDAISDKRQGTGYVLVANNLDVPIQVTGIALLKPELKETDARSEEGKDAESNSNVASKFTSFKNLFVQPDHFSVAGRSSGTAAVTLSTADRVTPGKQTVIFDVATEWDQGGHHYTRHQMVSKEVSVGVFFESEVLKALGVPSFLLLPGCLFVFTIQLLLTSGLWGVNRHSKLPDLPVTSPGFWIVAVTYSGVFAWAYTRLTGTDYLVRYGGLDLRNVWMWSILLGIVAYSIFAVATSEYRRLRVPKTTDDEITTLEKMGRRDVGIRTKQVQFKLGGEELRAFLIEQIADDEQLKVWVAPPIQTKWETVDALHAKDEASKIVNDAALNDRPSTSAEMTAVLRQAKTEKYATVYWKTEGSVPNPYHLDIQNITKFLERDQIVKIE